MSARRVVTTRRADEDIAAAIEHYLGQGAPTAALAFVDALEDAKVLMGEHPQLESTRLAAEVDIPELRTMALRRFPYLTLYTDDGDAVRVHRVLHTARDIPSGLFDG
ncbi:type II toxin-antitoxin system RelE/ParE family toxin [Microbacterium sp. A93]|uniref:type II toxin-antitoxin system RelE/ParE family toxin n=1 Tax=Microbacterium sp. A93 TaxID=3450716 RepID=UPI003F41C83D